VDDFDLDLEAGERREEVVPAQVGLYEVPVRMHIIGEMDAVHTVMLALPLRREEMEGLSLQWGEGPKSSFFLTRFILKKSSPEKADAVSLDFVASGYFSATPGS
jgi:hypothetical protein